MNWRLIIALAVGLALGIGGSRFLTSGSSQDNPQRQGVDQASGDYYTCPMHPSVRSDRPGACPVCGMALVKKSSEDVSLGVDLAEFKGIALSPTQRVLANVSTASASRKPLRREIAAVGVVSFAEPKFQRISMRFPGRVEKLHVTYTGQIVKKGEPVADVYSPEAVTAQQEYLLALDWFEQAGRAQTRGAEGARSLLQQAKEKLLLWDFTEDQIDRLEKSRKIQYNVTIHSPIAGTVLKKNVDPQKYVAMGEDIFEVADLSTVWVYLDLYEKDLRYVSVGQPVQVTTVAYPGEEFTGKVAFIDPVIDSETRTTRVRAEFPNPHGKLKPNMYADARVKIAIPHALVIPTSAVLSTGKRDVVWVEVMENAFEPRDVVVGASTEGYTQILSGISQGERVAETGGFLIDSESALQMPGAEDVHAGHGTEHIAASREASPEEKGEHEGHAMAASNVRVLVKGRYTPDVIHARVGEPLNLHFYRDEDADCTNEVVFEGLNIRRRLPARQTTIISFTPRDTGEIAFTCGMGMVRGKLIVER